MRVICCTMFSQAYKELARISIPNLKSYCERHGYEMRIIEVEDVKWMFKKHEFFKKVFDNNGADVIWYKDIDSLITNLSIPIENFIDETYPFYITKDFNELNGGSIIIKNNSAGKLLNTIVLENKDQFENEQNIFNSQPFLVFGIDFMKILPQNTINSYSYDLYPECKEYIGRHDLGDWREGDLLVHFPGLSIENRIEMMKEFEQKIIK